MSELHIEAAHSLKPALDIIKRFEGCRLHAYPDPGTGGAPWTIGWGHTRNVHPGDVCTQEQADQWLLEEVDKFAFGVGSCVHVPLTTNEYCALVSFSYNVGLHNFQKSSLLRKLNSGYLKEEVAYEFRKWTHAAGRVMKGLVRRRNDERTLFLT